MSEQFFNDSFIDYWCITFQEDEAKKSIEWTASKIPDLEVMMIHCIKLFNQSIEEPDKSLNFAEDLYEIVKNLQPSEKIKNPVESFKKCLVTVAKRFKSYLRRSINSSDDELVKANLGIVSLVGHIFNLGLDNGEIIFVLIGGELKYQHENTLYIHLLKIVKERTVEKIKNGCDSKGTKAVYKILEKEKMI